MDLLGISRPKILFIKGVFKYSSRDISNVIESTPEHFDILIDTFDSRDPKKWDEQPNVQCLTCSRMTEGRMIFVPKSYNSMGRYRQNDTARFCAWWCASRHIRFNCNNDERLKHLLNQLHKEWTGKEIIEIEPALPPWQLKNYGGAYDYPTYHALCRAQYERFQSSFADTQDHYFEVNDLSDCTNASAASSLTEAGT